MSAAAAATLDADAPVGALFAFDGSDDGVTTARLRPADLECHRLALTRYARQWLRNAADVEDAVQETLVAALMSPDSFAGRAAPATWLHGILKHKIIDTYRRQARETLIDPQADQELSDEVDAMFTADGQWREPPTGWGNPEAALARRDFHKVLQDCVEGLPDACARAFRMRELMEMEIGEICEILGISRDNCYVMLHRARMRLRALLEQHWFASAPPPCV